MTLTRIPVGYNTLRGDMTGSLFTNLIAKKTHLEITHETQIWTVIVKEVIFSYAFVIHHVLIIHFS